MQNFLDNNKIGIYILHVNDEKYLSRKNNIINMMKKYNLNFHWVLDGDISSLTPDVIDNYFCKSSSDYYDNGKVNSLAPMSCSYKHYKAWCLFNKSDYEYAMFLEDDIFLTDNFKEVFINSINEMKLLKSNNNLVKYSNADNRYVAKKDRKSGTYLYKSNVCKYSDAYLISKYTVNLYIDYIHKYKFTIPADHQINLIGNKVNTGFYWCWPYIAEQGTQSGVYISSIQQKQYMNFINKIKWQIKKYFRIRK